ncbi:Gfo/Idh/MocA family protein [Compostibacter hankyongensis]|uniref:Gfo/Idh/MocA family oxidoreductase n=1 Tax=Compostibacter hankyongensis TaxID=1007089 RepID=A0ABP8FZH1_9BACT
MKSNRRNFLKFTGLAGIGLTGGGLLKSFAATPGDRLPENIRRPHKQRFNMCGHAAPKLNTVRVGFVGLGQRGPGHLMNMTRLEGVEIKAVCDIRPEYANRAKSRVQSLGHNPDVYTGDKDAWKKMCDRNDIDIIYIATPWALHTPICIYAMEHGKHAFTEVPAALTIDECWQLVETSERTRKHCMMLENCCYGFFEQLTLNMTRQGYFGEIIHGEGAYNHNLLHLNFDKNGYWEMWRLKENMHRNGNLYPTHGLGPICQIMNINRGDQMEYLTSMSGIDFMMREKADELAAKDDFFKPFAGKTYRGNANTSCIRTHKGRTIMVQHDVTSPNVYSRIHRVVGTKGTALQYPLEGRISNGGEDWLKDEEMKAVEEKYQPPIVRKVGELAKKVGGHGGMDFLMDWRVIDCLRNGLPLDQDVYDAALWSCISPLSEWSVANRSKPIDVPDFTAGSWAANKPVDILLEQGGNTQVKHTER